VTSYTLETRYEIWNDHNGEKLTIGPDYDCIDLISIRQYSDDDKYTEIIVTKEQAMLILSALNKMFPA